MNFSALFHQFATWSFRAAILGGLLGVVYLAMRGDADMPGARLVASQAGTPNTQVGDFAPCQPIGQTADGELVYSMDCEQTPAEPVAGTPASATSAK
ncbi:hypothetical protein [Rhodopseudomonas pseudopalustris]|uniref:Uncharacterized protein n=1 Tax=Rhodopseudomonas pseudopalustris TaxID=1513892 RepID=A0A1H8S784_9BRAD|nr:hypothetical protein [Rhodopseudomonas pseudopalustris]SEO74013.1 hypothetical protein SAMN05444123_104294 [Rhodopseudomonas pseudopalustris]